MQPENITKFYVLDGNKMVERSIPISEAILMYSNNSSETYPPIFYKNTMKCKNWQKEIGLKIGNLLKPRSVVDFGCGLGYYLEGFKLSGAKVKGFEISYDNAKAYMSENIVSDIQNGDAMHDIDCGEFDLSMSIEVAEHILPEKSDILVRNLTKSSNNYILFTAAPPGQGGVCHINERERSFWVGLFNKYGFTLSQSDIENIRKELDLMPHYGKYFSLIKKQIMIFRRSK